MKNKHLAISITGPQHIKDGVSCQDFFSLKSQGQKTIGVVSDGAGSAKYGKIGARIICKTILDFLLNANENNARQRVEAAIMAARDKLIFHRFNKSKTEAEIKNFSATLIGFYSIKNRGFFFHIGDGAGLCFDDKNPQKFIATLPANGDFSCETFFYTMSDWKKHLRWQKFDNINTIFLMSDGLSNFALSSNFRHLEANFLLPIHSFLKSSVSKIKAKKALENTLNNAQAQKLNSDDKTILWAKL